MSRNRNWAKQKDAKEEESFSDSKTTKGKNYKGKNSKRSRGSMNDVAWYTPSPTALIQSAQVPRAWATGLEHDLTHSFGNYSKNTTPGFLACAAMMDPIESNDPNDPVNVVSRKIGAFIRSFNSGAKNYDPTDLMVRLLGEGAFIANLNWVQRIYYTAHMYNGYNRYMPEALLEAQNVDAANISRHLNDFVGALNDIIRRAQSIVFVPTGFNIYQRWSWLFANYYADSSSVKDQLYFMYPEYFYKYGLDEEVGASALKVTSWLDYANPTTDLLEWDGLIQGLNDMLSPIIEDQMFATMRGDMMKAYGASAYAFVEVTPAVAVPVDDPVVLNQFKNIRTKYAPELENVFLTDYSRYDIVQDENATYLKHRFDNYTVDKNFSVDVRWDGVTKTVSSGVPNVDGGFARLVLDVLQSDHPMDTYKPEPTVIDNMEDSRLTTMVTNIIDMEPTGTELTYTETHGCDYVYSMKLGRRVRLDSGDWMLELERLHTWMVVLDNSAPDGSFYNINLRDTAIKQHVLMTTAWSELLSDMTAFDYMPPIYFILGSIKDWEHDHPTINWNPSGNHFNWPMLRVCNLAFLVNTMAKKMNHCAMQGLFNINGWMNPKDTKITSK